MSIPVLGFAAFSGTGKTTLIEKLIPELIRRGIKPAVIKHDAHGLKFDKDGKDSQRFVEAGALMSFVNGPEVSAAFSGRSFSLEENIEMISCTAEITGVNMILVEGYKEGAIDKIGICREATQQGFTSDISEYVAVVTDMDVAGNVIRFGFDQVDELADWIVGKYCR